MDELLSGLARRFSFGPREFASCPLYGHLCTVVAADERLLRIAAACRAGQQPTNLLLGAVHHLLLADPARPLAEWYASIAADPRPAEDAGPAFTEFCLEHRDELVALVSTRLVQTNEVRRAAALRLGLHAVGERSVSLVEVGASAGLLLAFDRYGYRIGDRRAGDPSSRVQLDVEWRSDERIPDLDAIPAVTSRVGVDLHPIDPSDDEARRWLRALVWPGEEDRARQLERALDLVAADPPRIVAGDAIDVLPELDATLAPGQPVVVFHAATRAHVPADRREDFDRAIAALGERRPLHHLSLEGTGDPIPGVSGPAHVLELTGPDGSQRRIAAVDGHGEWIVPLRGEIPAG